MALVRDPASSASRSCYSSRPISPPARRSASIRHGVPSPRLLRPDPVAPTATAAAATTAISTNIDKRNHSSASTSGDPGGVSITLV